MIGNYPVNDDWIFVRQIEAFNQGIFWLNAKLDPSFLAQGLLGYLWSKFFGASFVSLQILTILVTLLGLWFFVKILKHFGVDKKLVTISALIYLFNPIIFNSTFSFMTDNYLLTFMLGAVYYFLRSFEAQSQKNMSRSVFLGALFTLLAGLTRQVGFFVGFSYVFARLFMTFVEKSDKKSKNVDNSLVFVVLAVFLGILISFLWPDYGSNRMFILPEQVFPRFKQWLLSLYYFPLFAFPLFLGLVGKPKKEICKGLFVVFLIVFTLVLYHLDIFAVGNVLYIENLHIKSNFRSNFSLFDNIFFKFGLAVVVGLSFLKLSFFVKDKIKEKKCKMTTADIFLGTLGILNFAVLLISSDFYDRYLLPSFVCLLLLFLKNHSKNIKVNWQVIASVILLTFISITLQWEFSTKTRIKWEQASALTEKTGYFKQIDLDDTYRKHAVTTKENDFTGLVDTKVFDKECYVQDYTLDSDSKILKFIQNAEEKIDKKILKKKKPVNVNKKEIPRIKNNLEILIYNQEYFSLLYTLVGKKAYVGSWCTALKPL